MSSQQNVINQQAIPVQHSMLTNVPIPSVVSSVPPMPVNTAAVGQFSPPVLISPTFPLPVGQYVCIPPPAPFPVQPNVATNAGNIPTLAPQVLIPEHRGSQDFGRYVHDGQRSVEEHVQEMRVSEQLQQQHPTHDRTDGRWSDDTLYRDRILDDDMSRERLEKRLMRERIERWRTRDGIDSDRVEFERLRTPHRHLIDSGGFAAVLFSCDSLVCRLLFCYFIIYVMLLNLRVIFLCYQSH